VSQRDTADLTILWRSTMDNRTGEISGMATQAAGKVKENVGEATGSKELEAKGLAQEARARRNIIVAP
jgi:hypothetical protein